MGTYKVFEHIQKSRKNISHYVVESASSTYQNDYPKHLFEWSNNSRYHSLNANNSFFRFDFVLFPVYVEKFMLLSTKNRDPKNWVLEGSTDRVNFIELYNNPGVNLCDELTTSGVISCKNIYNKTYSINNTGYYQSIRFRNTGDSSTPNDFFIVLSAIEFIGRISLKHNTIMCKSTSFQFIHSLSLIYLYSVL